MDFTHVIALVLGTLLRATLGVFLGVLFKSSLTKGRIRELAARFFAQRKLREHAYRRVNGLSQKTPFDTTQIDHASMQNRSIFFVLRTKSMSDWIYRTINMRSVRRSSTSLLADSSGPARQNYKPLKDLDASLSLIWYRFGWWASSTVVAYSRPRGTSQHGLRQ